MRAGRSKYVYFWKITIISTIRRCAPGAPIRYTEAEKYSAPLSAWEFTASRPSLLCGPLPVTTRRRLKVFHSVLAALPMYDLLYAGGNIIVIETGTIEKGTVEPRL